MIYMRAKKPSTNEVTTVGAVRGGYRVTALWAVRTTHAILRVAAAPVKMNEFAYSYKASSKPPETVQYALRWRAILCEHHCTTVKARLAVTCKLPELAVILIVETPTGVKAVFVVDPILLGLPQLTPNTSSNSKTAVPKTILVRREARSRPAKTMPTTVKPYQNWPKPFRGLDTLAMVSVLIFTVTFRGRALALREEGLNRQTVFAGNPAQEKLTDAGNVPLELTLMPKLPVPPCGTVNEVADRVREI